MRKVGLNLSPGRWLTERLLLTATISSLAVPLLYTPPAIAQTYSVGASGKLVQKEPLLAQGETTIFFDGRGRPIRQIEEKTKAEDDVEVQAASLQRTPTSYSKRHTAVIRNIQMVARRYQRDPALRRVELTPRQWAAFFQAMIKVESNYNPTARSHADAIGLAQIIPPTAQYLRIDVNDPVQNLDGGARYLLEQFHDFGDVRLALAAYNAGPQAVRKYGGIPPYKETQKHVRRVLAEYAQLLN